MLEEAHGHCCPIIQTLFLDCTMSDLSSSNFSNWIWGNTFGIATTDSVLPQANHIMHQIPYLRKHWSTRRSKEGKELKHFPYILLSHTWTILCAHCFWCSLCKFHMDNVEYEQKHVEILTNWNIDYLYVPCLLLIKACTHKNVKIKKSETAKPIQKHSWQFPPKSIVQVEILKRMNFRFLFFLLISCPIKSSKSKLAPLRLSIVLQKVKIGKIWRWVYFVKDLQLLDQLHFGVTTYNDIYSWDVEQNQTIE